MIPMELHHFTHSEDLAVILWKIMHAESFRTLSWTAVENIRQDYFISAHRHHVNQIRSSMSDPQMHWSSGDEHRQVPTTFLHCAILEAAKGHFPDPGSPQHNALYPRLFFGWARIGWCAIDYANFIPPGDSPTSS